ncbi:MAG: RagB/SusD family nutrient uptake outer membrane protein [Chitinophagales bacterium]|nr:RagB/SusD family nutrient uptake outer membrane protein [Chitinophagales bacterium]
MKTTFSKSILILAIAGISFTLSSCFGDLNRSPYYGLNTETVYSDPANYINVLAKLYAGLAITGNQGPAGQADISGIDEGFSGYVRVLWNLQELPTDEAVCAWADPGIPELHQMDWNSENSFVTAMYYRIYYQIPLCNEFIRQSKLSEMQNRGFSQADIDRITIYQTEARFLRALSYYHALDLFGNVPFIDENDLPGSSFPTQISRADLFNYVESELLAVENDLIDAKQNEYGRADKAAAWMVLAKLYLNAEVYNGVAHYTEAVTYSKKVIDAGYTLQPKYTDLFLTDNNLSNEIIFPVTSDGLNTQTYGGTTFLVHAPVGGKMKPADFGINGGWAGYRTTAAFTAKFGVQDSVSAYGDTLDSRNLFFIEGQKNQIAAIKTFADGYAIAKWKNLSSAGVKGSDAQGNFVDTDFPMFRLADAYLMYAEAVKRGGGGDEGTATGYINALRERAYVNSSANITSSDLTLDLILDERARELYWEGTRRTDLIRYGRFTTNSYLWPWKGGVAEGTSVADFRNIYPIPNADIVANTNLTQNFGY